MRKSRKEVRGGQARQASQGFAVRESRGGNVGKRGRSSVGANGSHQKMNQLALEVPVCTRKPSRGFRCAGMVERHSLSERDADVCSAERAGAAACVVEQGASRIKETVLQGHLGALLSQKARGKKCHF